MKDSHFTAVRLPFRTCGHSDAGFRFDYEDGVAELTFLAHGEDGWRTRIVGFEGVISTLFVEYGGDDEEYRFMGVSPAVGREATANGERNWSPPTNCSLGVRECVKGLEYCFHIGGNVVLIRALRSSLDIYLEGLFSDA